MMSKTLVSLSCLALLTACATPFNQSEDEGYFADATDCERTSMQKQQMKVPTGTSMSIIDVPTGLDAGAFSNCMSQAGHPPSKADPNEYLTLSTRCLDEARHADDPDQAYSRCIRRGNISVETIDDEKSE